MAGDDSSDFTFCRVSLPVDEFNVESPKALQSIQKIKLDESSNDATNGSEGLSLNDTHNREIINAQQTDNLQREVVKASGSGGGTSESSDATTEKKPVQKKPVRAKVPFEKGYSQMDWLKLTQTDPDLAGLKGKSNRRLITLEEVKQHKNTEGHIWTVLKGRVYNISPYLKFHPGGVDMLMKAAGKDCTSLFNKYHAWVNAEFLIEKCLVGYLDVNE